MLHQYPAVISYNLQILHTPKRPNVNASRQAHNTGASGSPLSGYFSALIRVTCCTGPQGMTATIGTYRIYVLSPLLSTAFFPTCQVRVVRFYVRHFSSSSSSSSSSFLSFFFLLCNPVRSVFRAGPQRRVCEISVPRRTSTASLRDQCAAPDLNRESARSVLRAGPQPRVCEISVACRTSTASLRDQCSAPDLNREMRQKEECQKDCQRICQKECQKICQKECQKICQKICQKE